MAQTGPRILLVNPRFNANSFWSMRGTVELMGAVCLAPPLGLITIAAMLPAHWQCRLIDRNAEELSDDDILKADLVMSGGMLPQEPDLLAIMARCASLGVPICVGGPAPTSTPDVYAHADYLVVGEAESVIADFIAAFERGDRDIRFTSPKFKADVTTTPVPRFDLLKLRNYAWVNLQFSRGCPFTCEFCDIIELYGRAPRTKQTEQMLGELDRLYATGYRGHVDFVDDNLIGNKKQIKKFLPHLIAWQEKRGFPFKLSTEASLNLSDDPELLTMMREAGFFALFTGIETPDEETLVHMQKKQNTRRGIGDSVHRINEAGIYVVAGFVVGFDTEAGSVARSMIDCIRETSVPTATVSLLTALPNTQLTRRLGRENRLLDQFRRTMTESGDMCTAGLNFETLRPRREIMTDYRDVVAQTYHPTEFFYRVRTLSEHLKPARLKRKLHLRNALREAIAFARLSAIMTFKYPELRREFWFTVSYAARRNIATVEAVVRNISHYVYLYPFSQYLVRTVEERLADLDAGKWMAQPASPARETAPTPELATAAA